MDIKDEIVVDNSNRQHVIGKILSSGGQGAVYKTKDPSIIIKLYNEKEETDKEEMNEGVKNIFRLPIPKNIKLTLPMSLINDKKGRERGYVMHFLSEMKSISDFFSIESETIYTNTWLDEIRNSNEDLFQLCSNYIITGGKIKRLKSYIEVSKTISKLHMNGLVYCDVSNNNIFLSKKLEDNNVYLIDADNINYQKETQKNGYYTPWFCAPEIRTKGCSFYSDDYSVLISSFNDLLMVHPFRGAMLETDDFVDDNIEIQASNSDIPWIMDKDYQDNNIELPIYDVLVSQELQNIFSRGFDTNKGRIKKKIRPKSYEIAYYLSEEIDKTIKCKNCEMDYICDDSCICSWCDHKNKVLKLTSYKMYKDKKVLIKEIYTLRENKIKVPTKLVEDFLLDKTEEVLFEVNLDNNLIEISELNHNFDYKLIYNGEENNIFSSVKFKENDFTIKCDSNYKNDNIFIKNIIIEVEEL